MSERKNLIKSIKSYFNKISLNLSILSSKLRSFAEEVLSSDEVINELFLVSSSSSINSSLLEPEVQPIITSPEMNYQDFDSVSEADKLRTEEPFVDGIKIWQLRRNSWLSATPEEKLIAKQKANDSVLNVIPKDSYSIIYHNLVDKQKTLKKPLNLRDAIKIINAGWINNGKWERANQGAP